MDNDLLFLASAEEGIQVVNEKLRIFDALALEELTQGPPDRLAASDAPNSPLRQETHSLRKFKDQFLYLDIQGDEVFHQSPNLMP